MARGTVGSVPTQAEKGADFRALHEGEPFVIPNPWDAGSARVLEGLGFKALATTSSGFAFTLGRRDGRATLDEVVEHTRAIVDATDVPGPRRMVALRINGETDDLDVAPVELGLNLRHVPELGRAHGREILRMREQDRPRIADPVVEMDLSFRGLGLEVRSRFPNLQCHSRPPSRLSKMKYLA